jgi:hypothetical protein
MGNITLPNDWRARPHQRGLFDYMFGGEGLAGKRAVEVWHRRAGKDSASLNLAAIAAHQRVGTIWHMLPTLNHARKVIWEGIDKYGRRMIDQAFPKQLRESKNNTDMQIRLANGSVWQCVGSDNFDSLVGANPVGVVFSEYSVADPQAWDYIRPILAENGGWAIFIYTPRSKNHGYRLYEMAKENPAWRCARLTVEDTFDENGNRLIPDSIVDEERAAGMDERMIQQEFYCDFDTGLVGAFYSDQMKYLRQRNRIGNVPWDPSRPVHTFWDIGIRDATSIWFAQEDDMGNRKYIDYEEDSNVPLTEWIRRCKMKPYTYGVHRGPHDMKQREKSSGKDLLEVAEDLGFFFELVPKTTLMAGIEMSKQMLPRCMFDETACARGIEALDNYRRQWNDQLHIFMDRPLHDWASHGADAFRMSAIDWPERAYVERQPIQSRFKVKRAIG